ncbi:zf-TFIIB domain-containing protein [Aquihabitans sp. G128]|uniref:TFIIB-type zinc ribbon-containing protein n=1 Tax=Aquihabitans sp. G128 TaxID=2849779 RepID=UPI00211217DE|nr:zf-TFIIB domain-containing protein [Aquihabitans sp. G128]
MHCPNDQSVLIMSERQGIEIDYCPECRGVWLDRGELDKIVERSVNIEAPSSPPSRGEQRDDRHDGDRGREGGDRGGVRKKKRGGALADLFDFG